MLRNLLLLALCGVSSAAQVHQAGSVPRGWTATAERVRADAVFHNVMIGLKRSNAAALKGIAAEVSNPQHANYLQYPTYEEVGALVRPAAAHMAAVEQWVAAHGATVVVEHPHGDYVQIEATAGQLEAMAGGKFTTFVHGETGKTAHRMVDGVSVSDDVADAIESFTGFSTLPVLSEPKVTTRVGDNTVCPVTPSVVRATYNVTEPSSAVRDGKKPIQAIAQFQGQYVSDTDLAAFCTKYDPTSGSCAVAKYVGDKNDPTQAGLESMLDTEYITSLSNGATTWVYTYASFDFCGDLHTFASDVTGAATHPSVISISYGSQFIGLCDAAAVKRFGSDLEKMATLGVTVMISSGDDGSGHVSRQGINQGKLSPSYPASAPYAIAVGSTYWASGTTGPEEATTQFGSGGGFSYDYEQPSYQTEAVSTYLGTVDLPTKYAYAKTGRGTPDVSALGQDFEVFAKGRPYPGCIGGTSASSPSFAGLVTLLNKVCIAESGKTLGFANPLFYQNPQIFRDVTLGTNAIDVNKKEGWAAIKGWDAATGLGTPDFPKMVDAVKKACASTRK